MTHCVSLTEGRLVGLKPQVSRANYVKLLILFHLSKNSKLRYYNNNNFKRIIRDLSRLKTLKLSKHGVVNEKIAKVYLLPLIDALNLSPAKNKVTKKLYSFKTKTIDKFQRQRSKSNAFEHFLHKPEKREANTQKTVFGNRILASSTPLKRDSNVWETSKVNYAKYKEDSSSPVYDFQGAKPKLRKKRSAPMPPGAPLDPDTEKVEHFNESDVHENGLGRSNENNEIYPIPGAQTNSEVEEVSTIRENQSSSLSLKPVETKENITI